MWAAGYTFTQDDHYTTYLQHFDGERWQVARAQNPKPYLSALSSVSAVSIKDAWVVGVEAGPSSPPAPLLERWNGHAWAVVAGAELNSSCDAQLTDVAAVSRDDIWAVGTQTCGPAFSTLVEHWDGTSWTRVESPNPGPAHTSGLQSVSVVSGDDVWAVGSSQTSDPSHSRNLVLRWNGRRWRSVASPNQSHPGCSSWSLLGVSADAASDAWAVGTRSCGGVLLPQTLRWDGTAWRAADTPRPGFFGRPSAELHGVVAISPRLALAGGITTGADGGDPAGYLQRWNGHRWILE